MNREIPFLSSHLASGWQSSVASPDLEDRIGGTPGCSPQGTWLLCLKQKPAHLGPAGPPSARSLWVCAFDTSLEGPLHLLLSYPPSSLVRDMQLSPFCSSGGSRSLNRVVNLLEGWHLEGDRDLWTPHPLASTL